MVTSLSLEGYCTSLSGVFLVYSVCGRKWGKNSVLGRFVVGRPTFGNPISKTIQSSRGQKHFYLFSSRSISAFLVEFEFLRNLSDSEIEDLEGLMRSLDDLYLSPSVPDARFWPLSSSGLFSVKSFFLALSQSSGSSQNFPSKFVWNSQVPFKMKSFVWLVAHKKVNTNDMLQVRRPYKALSPDICILCM